VRTLGRLHHFSIHVRFFCQAAECSVLDVTEPSVSAQLVDQPVLLDPDRTSDAPLTQELDIPGPPPSLSSDTFEGP
jgi:hypothetical protein